MNNYLKNFILAVVILAAIIGGGYWLKTKDWQTYTNTADSYQVSYPKDFTVKENEPVQMLAGQMGTVFNYPTSYSTSTNLDWARVYVAVTPTCPEPFVGFGATTTVYTSGINTFNVSSITDAAMGGQRGTFTTYSLTKNNKCYVIEKAIAYHDISFLQGAGVTDLPKPYDQSAIDSTFFKILDSFKVTN